MKLPEIAACAAPHHAGVTRDGAGETSLVEVLLRHHVVDGLEFLRVFGMQRGLDLADTGLAALGDEQAPDEIADGVLFIGAFQRIDRAGVVRDPGLAFDILVQRLVDRKARRGAGEALQGGDVGGAGLADDGGNHAVRDALADEKREERLAGGQDGGIAAGGLPEFGEVREDPPHLLLDGVRRARTGAAADEDSVHHVGGSEDLEGVAVGAGGLQRRLDEAVHLGRGHAFLAGDEIPVLVHLGIGFSCGLLDDLKLLCEFLGERVDRRLHGENAARREGLALAVVIEQHGLLHALRNLRLATEHFGDGLPEKRARLVVVRHLAGVAPPLVDAVGPRLGAVEDRALLEGVVDAGADDGLLRAGVEALLGEVHEGLKAIVDEVDWHGVSPG